MNATHDFDESLHSEGDPDVPLRQSSLECPDGKPPSLGHEWVHLAPIPSPTASHPGPLRD